MQWSEGRKKSFIISAIRSGFRRWPPKYVVLADSCVGVKINKATGRKAKHYKCNICKKDFPAKEVQADHIEPVVDPKVGFVDWNTFIERIAVDVDGYQCLCKGCHSKKTKEENSQRKKK